VRRRLLRIALCEAVLSRQRLRQRRFRSRLARRPFVHLRVPQPVVWIALRQVLFTFGRIQRLRLVRRRRDRISQLHAFVLQRTRLPRERRVRDRLCFLLFRHQTRQQHLRVHLSQQVERGDVPDVPGIRRREQ
jgi:hypothetical protein